MKTNNCIILLFAFIPAVFVTGCFKDYTEFRADAEDPGLAIFSNTGNNIMTCFINNRPWRTNARTTSLFGRPRYEVVINKQVTGSLTDTLHIEWSGYFGSNQNDYGYTTLVLPVAKDFGYKNLSALQGQRLSLDTTNGFFTTSIAGLNPGSAKGSGNVYFHTARFDSISPGVYKGAMSGLFEADFTTFKITKGRFDHAVIEEQINFY